MLFIVEAITKVRVVISGREEYTLIIITQQRRIPKKMVSNLMNYQSYDMALTHTAFLHENRLESSKLKISFVTFRREKCWEKNVSFKTNFEENVRDYQKSYIL